MIRILHLISKLPTTENIWMLLFAAGWGELATGEKFLVDEQSFELVIQSIAARGNEVVFDYEHASLEKEAAPAAGWIKELAWEEGVGIKVRVEWTDKAAQFVANKEYRYFSPVFYVRKSDSRVVGLDSVALTNRPKTNNLTPILARLEAGLEKQTKEEIIMDREKLIAALGLAKDATDEQIIAAMATLGIKMPEESVKEVIPEKIITALDLKQEDDVSTIVASIEVLKQTNGNSVSIQEFTKLQARLNAKDANEAVAAAMDTGKIAPAQKDWALKYATDDLPGFTTFVSKAPVVVPVTDLPGKKDTTVDPVTDEATVKVAGMMGVDLEDIKKYG